MKDKCTLTLNDEETVKTAAISPELHTEWITFRTLLAKKPEDSIALQLKSSSQMKCWLQCSQTYKMVAIGLTLLVSTASVERSFTQMKKIKTRLRNSLTEGRLTHLMRIAIQSPDQLTVDEIEVILDIWNRKLNPVNNYRNNYSSLCCNS